MSPAKVDPMSTDAHQMPIVGVVRFSVLTAGPSDFRKAAELPIEQRARVLFDPAHLETRFRTFEALTLPSLTAQTVETWRAVILYSDLLPKNWRDRLLDLVAPDPRILAVEMSPADAIAPTLHRVVCSSDERCARRFAMFRLDDDDGLSSRFIQRLQQLLPLTESAAFGITFPRGFLIGTNPGSRRISLAPFKRFGIGCGLTIVGPSKPDFGVFDLGVPHQRVDEVLPTISESSEPAFVLLMHEQNDSGQDTGRHALLTKAKPMWLNAAKRRLGPSFAHLRLEELIG